jgi:LysM repeat protein
MKSLVPHRPVLGLALAAAAAALWLAAPGPAAAGRGGTYTIKKGDTPGSVAKRFGVSVEELLRYNSLGPKGPFRVGDTLDIPAEGEVTGAKYVVQQGDSVARVADFHGVSQDDLREANKLGPDDALKAGDEIVIPTSLRGGAEDGHVVRKGDTLASIAKKHGVTAAALARANKLKKGSPLKLGRTLVIPEPDDAGDAEKLPPAARSKLVVSGEKVAGGVRHTVQPGQTIWIIARAYNVKGGEIAKRNGISTATPLKPGQEILVPGAKEPVPVRVKGWSAQPIRFVRVWNNASVTTRLINKAGNVLPDARRKVSNLSGPRTKSKRIGKSRLLSPRLLQMVQRVAERWPGNTIEIISGYRPRMRGHESRHSMAKALDFRVKGVPNRELYEFCKELPNSGCGYYPNSVFVHMDTREKSATWVDYSAPGQRARYQRPKDAASEEGANAEAEADFEEADHEAGGETGTGAQTPVDGAGAP